MWILGGQFVSSQLGASSWGSQTQKIRLYQLALGLALMAPGGNIAPCFNLERNCLRDGKEQHSGQTAQQNGSSPPLWIHLPKGL